MPIQLLSTHAHITAFGVYVPDKCLTNEDMATLVDTNDEWIVQRTGIKERRQAAPHQFASDLGYKAVLHMEKQYPDCLHDVDGILVATSTPDTFFPSTAAIIQAKLGLSNCMALDISNACAGFVSAMQLAIGLLDAGMHRKVLVIGSEVLTKTVDYTDRSTCILFGDGAGALILERESSPSDAQRSPSIIASLSNTQGDVSGTLYRSALADRINEAELNTNGLLVQNGREVYKWALQQIPLGVEQILQLANIKATELDLFVPHSANLRMIESICQRTGISIDNTLTSVIQYGNTSAASIPLALHNGIWDNKLKSGDLVLLYGFGGGLSQSALLLRWTL